MHSIPLVSGRTLDQSLPISLWLAEDRSPDAAQYRFDWIRVAEKYLDLFQNDYSLSGVSRLLNRNTASCGIERHCEAQNSAFFLIDRAMTGHCTFLRIPRGTTDPGRDTERSLGRSKLAVVFPRLSRFEYQAMFRGPRSHRQIWEMAMNWRTGSGTASYCATVLNQLHLA
jgi:hypothetical protein